MEQERKAPARRDIYASYGIGLFGIALLDLYALLIPLLGVAIGLSATEIGILMGARSFLPLFFSIHAGSLMDRLGTRRVMVFCTAAVAGLALLFPATAWFPALLALQLLSGLFITFNWIGAQTLVAQLCGGDAATLGRFNFVVRIGTIGAPVLAGLLWDLAGAWPTFAMIALWALVMHALVRLVPEPDAERLGGVSAGLRQALPRVSDYTRAFALMLIPAIAFTVVASGLRNGSSGIQNSLYVVYLEGIGYTGTLIGALFSALEITIALASLVVGAARKLGRPEWVLIVTTVASIVLIAVTPFLGGLFVLLLLMQMLRGVAQGLMQPMMYSIQSHAAGRDRQGAVVGLRITANRLSSTLLPPIMGVIADSVSLEASFVLSGGLLLLGCAWLTAVVLSGGLLLLGCAWLTAVVVRRGGFGLRD